MNKRGVICITAVLILTAVFSACSEKMQDKNAVEQTDREDRETAQQPELNEDGTITLAEGYASHGFHAEDGTLFDTGSIIECENGSIKGQIEFQQNTAGTMNYGLIIMADFVQKKFTVQNEQFDCYRFSLTDEERAIIQIEFPADDDAYEWEYLIVPEPDAKDFSMDSDSGWNNFMATRGVFTGSYRMEDKSGGKRFPHVYEQTDTDKLGELKHDGNTGFQLVKSSKDLRVFDSAKAGSRACLCLGGMREEAQAYAVVAFCGWKQTEISKGQLVRCYTSVPDRNSYDEIIFPNIKEDAVYQMFAFELPFESRPAAMVNAAFRIKLEGR